MYNRENNGYSEESKYVASILSTMASAAAVTSYSIPSSFVSGITSQTSSTGLTPTTLANIEQTFIELQSVPTNLSSGQDPMTQSGFVPPIVDPAGSDRSSDRYDYSDMSDSEWTPSSKRARTSDGDSYDMQPSSTIVRKRRNLKDEKLSPEEEERRRVRRERNKVAAAKCRQRRVDHTNRLIIETEKLEKDRDSIQDEIHTLQQQKDQLEFILQTHQPLCKVETTPAPPQNMDSRVKVKAESSLSPCSRSKTVVTSSGSSVRPSSLPLIKQEKKDIDVSVSTATGIPITTPSSGFFFTLDNMVDHTGLTPITNGPSSCSSEVNRTSSESSSENVNSPTLISL